jgi:Zn-dependent protease with chaperone function
MNYARTALLLAGLFLAAGFLIAGEGGMTFALVLAMNILAYWNADRLFSTHPNTANRVHRLQEMAGAAGPWD